MDIFERARAMTGGSGRQVVIVRPDLSLLVAACPDAGAMPAAAIEQVERIVPSTVKRNIAVVTDTSFAPAGERAEVGSPVWARVGMELPFFGILNGLGCIGHSVWICDASAEMGVACREADILIVDSAVTERMPEASLTAARAVMRTGSIFVHDRQTFQLRALPSPAKTLAGWEAVFDEARARTSEGGRRRIVMVRGDRSLLGLTCIPREKMTTEQLSAAHRVIPEGAFRNVAVIASTELVADPADSQSAPAVAQLRAAARAIPFFGLLLNLASVGNPTWIFGANPEALTAGCRNADLLFIDGALSNQITMEGLDAAMAVMRSSNVAAYDRNSKTIRMVRSLGGSMDKLAFRD